MSGIAAATMTNGAPANARALSKMLAAIPHGGPHHSYSLVRAGLALGYLQCQATPESAGERQPLVCCGERLALAFDGRLDNRDELRRELSLSAPHARGLSDAALVLHAYEAWETAALARLLGPFALIAADFERRTLLAARDPLGSRTLYYHANHDRVLLASQEQALLAAPGVPDTLDEVAVAHFLAHAPLGNDRTMFHAVRAVPAGGWLRWDITGQAADTFWDWTSVPDVRHASDDAYAAHFLALLRESVRCRLRGPTPPAVLMSGGLDSTAVAALAAQAHHEPLTTLSWVYSELRGPDERQFIDAVNVRWRAQAVSIRCDDAWPLSGTGWPHNPNHPFSDAFERLSERAYHAAAQRGTRVLLTGLFADHLYLGADHWLTELIAAGRLVDAARQWNLYRRQFGLRHALTGPSVRRVGRSALRPFGEMRLSLDAANVHVRPWLAARTRALLQAHAAEPPPGLRRPGQWRSLLGPECGRIAASKAYHATRWGIELRHPYRDRRLVAFALGVPAYQLYGNGRTKHIARHALRGLLPEHVRLRTHVSSFAELFLRGLADREAGRAAHLLARPDARWRHFIKPSLLPELTAPGLRRRLHTLSEPEQALVWRCLSLELWLQQARAARFEHSTQRSFNADRNTTAKRF